MSGETLAVDGYGVGGQGATGQDSSARMSFAVRSNPSGDFDSAVGSYVEDTPILARPASPRYVGWPDEVFIHGLADDDLAGLGVLRVRAGPDRGCSSDGW